MSVLVTGIHNAGTEREVIAAAWILAFASMTVEGVVFVVAGVRGYCVLAGGIRIGLGIAHANGCRRMLRIMRMHVFDMTRGA